MSELWPAGRGATGKPSWLTSAPRESSLRPVPPGRGRWRFTLHNRPFVAGVNQQATAVTEIMDARSRRLERGYNGDSTLTFSLDGESPAAFVIKELQHDVIAWRWDELAGGDQIMFRGPVTQSQDTLSEQSDTVNFTCHDYLAMMGRRLLSAKVTWTQLDQDDMMVNFVNLAKTVSGFEASSYIPLVVSLVAADGTARNKSGVLRDRTYEVGQKLDEALTNLAACEGGFDFDVAYGYADDHLRVFYPFQGTLRSEIVLEYGSTVASLSRSINSSEYANYWRVLGSPPDNSPEGTPPISAVASDPNVNNVIDYPVGLWQSGDNASDVKVQRTLQDKADADLRQSYLVPAYSLELTPNVYRYGVPNMGDTLRLSIHKGRLDVDTDVRVVGMSFDITDDGAEVVHLEVGRPDVRWRQLFVKYDRDINALARR